MPGNNKNGKTFYGHKPFNPYQEAENYEKRKLEEERKDKIAAEKYIIEKFGYINPEPEPPLKRSRKKKTQTAPIEKSPAGKRRKRRLHLHISPTLLRDGIAKLRKPRAAK